MRVEGSFKRTRLVRQRRAIWRGGKRTLGAPAPHNLREEREEALRGSATIVQIPEKGKAGRPTSFGMGAATFTSRLRSETLWHCGTVFDVLPQAR